MKIGSLAIEWRKKGLPLQPLSTARNGWWPLIHEPFTGAWQRNQSIELSDVLSHPTAFACITLIASDIAKMRIRLVELDSNGIWKETDSSSFSPVLRKPNRYSTRITLFKSWIISKLSTGNAYVLKQRNNRGGEDRGNVTALYVLDPSRVTPLVAQDGSVYYELKRDDLSGQSLEALVVPASEIIHDIMHPLYHPLMGLSPVYACGLAALLGLKIQTSSEKMFTNGSAPGGVLSAPGAITQETADRLKAYWETEFSGDNVGKVAVLGDALHFEPMAFTPLNSQLTEQWKEAALAICSTFHVPAYKVGAGDPPAYANIEAMDRGYYSQCLQELIESIELLLDEGLGLGPQFGNAYGTEFDLDDLMRLDSATMMTTLAAGVNAGLLAPNEGRKKINQPPVKGGEVPILQQQMWPIDQLAERATPQIPASPSARPAPDEDEDDEEIEDDEQMAASIGALLRKELELTV